MAKIFKLKNEEVGKKFALARNFLVGAQNALGYKDFRGVLNEATGRRVSDGLEFRNTARYDENAEITREHAEHNIALAKDLIEFLEKRLKQK